MEQSPEGLTAKQRARRAQYRFVADHAVDACRLQHGRVTSGESAVRHDLDFYAMALWRLHEIARMVANRCAEPEAKRASDDFLAALPHLQELRNWWVHPPEQALWGDGCRGSKSRSSASARESSTSWRSSRPNLPPSGCTSNCATSSASFRRSRACSSTEGPGRRRPLRTANPKVTSLALRPSWRMVSSGRSPGDAGARAAAPDHAPDSNPVIPFFSLPALEWLA